MGKYHKLMHTDQPIETSTRHIAYIQLIMRSRTTGHAIATPSVGRQNTLVIISGKSYAHLIQYTIRQNTLVIISVKSYAHLIQYTIKSIY